MGRWIRIRVIGGIVDAVAAGPKARTADLVRIGLLHHNVRDPRGLACEARRCAAGKACDRQIEAAPEEMDGAGLPQEASPKLFHHAIALHQSPPEAVRILGIIGAVNVVLAERDRAGDLARLFANLHFDIDIGERLHDSGVKIRHASRPQLHSPMAAVAHVDVEKVSVEIELDFEGTLPVGDRRGRQPLGAHIQGDMPAVIEPGSARQADLADDLRPQVQRVAGVPPLEIGYFGPERGVGGRHRR